MTNKRTTARATATATATATARTTADPFGMTNKRTGNSKNNGNGEIQGSLHCGGKSAAFGRDDVNSF
jgi:hypothetical protein